MLPFTHEQFIAIFASYNEAIWPVQIVAYLLGIGAVAAVFRPGRRSSQLIVGVLAIMWLWTAVAYHILFFASVNPAAYAFGVMFAVQAVILGSMAVAQPPLRFEYPGGLSGYLGVALIVYAAILYPIIGFLTGYAYPAMPVFGVTPCPITLFTFGLLLLTTSRVPGWLVVIPGLWSVVGGTAAFLLDVPQDWILLVSGLIAIPILMLRHQRRSEMAHA